MPSSRDILDRLQEYLSNALRTGRLVLSRNAQDGRLNSQDNERQISLALELYAISNEWFSSQALKLEVAPPRCWFDFSISNEVGLFLPVNVKVSSFRSSDNVSSKEGLFFALTGVQPSTVRINTWEKFCEQLAEHLGKVPDADYYFMVINKDAPGEVFWSSLKNIAVLDANGSNPPFQCHWGKNRQREERSTMEAQKYILGVLRKTFELRAEAFYSFERHLNEYV